MQKSHKKSQFPHFLRKWSELIRTALLSNFLNSKQALFLSTFIFVRKICVKSAKFVYCFRHLPGENQIGTMDYQSIALLWMGSTKSIDANTDALLRSTKRILFLPDCDQAGAVAWIKYKRLFPQIHQIFTPIGKGTGDAWLAGIDLRKWIKSEIKNSNKK